MTEATRVESAHPNRRRFRSHMVNHEVRFRLVADDAVFAFVAAVAAIGILYVLSNRQIGDSMFSAHLSLVQTRELLAEGVKVAGAVVFCAVLLFGIWSLIDAHRIAGPMHRLKRLLSEIGEGVLTQEIRFRRRDEFQEIAAAADRLVENYATRIASIRRATDQVGEQLERSDLSAADLQAVRQRVADLRRDLAFFRLPSGGDGGTVEG